MKLILAPVDFSPVSVRVVETTASLAKAIDGYVILLHVVPLPADAADYAMAVSGYAAVASREEVIADQRLASLRLILDEQVIPSQVVRLRGDPRRLIPGTAHNFRADYVVIGSHGHGALHELVAGSTARAVLGEARGAVVVVPPPKAQDLAAPAPPAEIGRLVTTHLA